ncbi:hypothetical protein CR513_05222, partial [Mucuna pruriens]
MIKHKQGELNVVANALSRRHTLIVMLETKMLGLDFINKLYEKDIDFCDPYTMCTNATLRKKLSVLMSSIRQLLVKKAHEDGLMGHFGELKTLEVLSEHFFWSRMRKDVHNMCNKSLVCKLAKSKVSSHELYSPFPNPTTHWSNISIDFVLGLTRFKRGRKSILWWLIGYNVFQRLLYQIETQSSLSRLRTKLLYSTTYHPQTDKQIKVVNRTLGQLLRCFVKRSLKDWEKWIPHVEFAYNRVLNTTTSYSPFKLAYGFNPLSSPNLFPLPILPICANNEGLSKAKFVQKLHGKPGCTWKEKENNRLEVLTKRESKSSLRKEILYGCIREKNDFPT